MLNTTFFALSFLRACYNSPLYSNSLSSITVSHSNLERSFSAIFSVTSFYNKNAIFERSKFSHMLNSVISIDSSSYERQYILLKLPIREKKCSVVDCIFRYCQTPSNGGAISMEVEDSSLSVLRSVFEKCTSNGEGGAIYFFGSTAQVFDCASVNCSAVQRAQAFLMRTKIFHMNRIVRVSTQKCPLTPPDTPGNLISLISGDQNIRELNSTESNILSGPGIVYSVKPNEFDGLHLNGCNIKSSNLFHMNCHPNTLLNEAILRTSNFINCTCNSNEIIYSDSLLYIYNSIFLQIQYKKTNKDDKNGVSEHANEKDKDSIDIGLNQNEELKNLISAQNLNKIIRNDANLMNKAVFSGCTFDTNYEKDSNARFVDSIINTNGQTHKIGQPLTPLIPIFADIDAPQMINFKIVILSPICVIAALLGFARLQRTHVSSFVHDDLADFERI